MRKDFHILKWQSAFHLPVAANIYLNTKPAQLILLFVRKE